MAEGAGERAGEGEAPVDASITARERPRGGDPAMRETGETGETDEGERSWGASQAMDRGAPGGDEDGHLAQVLMARLFPSQVARPRIGRFDLLEFLGEGGMGSVYAAYDGRLDRRVAIKFLRPHAGAAEAEARLLREAQALARLSHPNIVAVHEVWEEEGRIHVAMEFVDGEDLASWQRGDRRWREVLEVYRQAGEGLRAAHAAGLVHRDFKPHNAIRRRDGVVKVLDFGLARVAGSEADGAVLGDMREVARAGPGAPAAPIDANQATPSLTRTGAIMGTPMYMAPEQHQGRAADARSDQYSFCVALWEGLYGQLPFAMGTLEEVRAAILAGDRVEPRELRGVPAWIRRVLDRGLARDPAARFPSMQALLRELGRDPALRRRRIAGGMAAVAAMIAGGLGIAELQGRSAPPACVADAPIWSAERQAATRAGVVGAGDPVARATWSRLEPRLAAYAASLTTTRRDACEAHRRGLRSDALYDLEVACLDRREAGLLRLTDLFAAGDPEAVLRAMTAVAELPAPGPCRDAEALAREQAPPDDPASAARVAALRQELARAASEESAGKYAEAEARAAAVVEAAAAIDYPPLRAEALLRRGSAAMQRGDPESGRTLDLSLWTALGAEHRSVAAEAAAKRIFARVELADRSADVREAIDLAAALVARDGAGDWRTRWLLANNAAGARERRGELSEALAGYKDALEEIPGDGDADDSQGTPSAARFERAATLQNMAALQVRLGEREAGEAAARQAVAEFRDLYGVGHPSTANAEAIFADVLAKIGRRREAAVALSAAIDRAAATRDPAPLWMLLQAARLALAGGDVERAIAWCERAEPQLRLPDGGRSPWALPFAAVRARVAALAGDPGAASILDAVDPEVRARNHSFVDLERAEIAWLLGHVEEAEALSRALVEGGGAAEAERQDARVLLARSLVARGAFAEAESLLRGAIEGDAVSHEPEPRALALATLAAALVGQGREEEGRALARAAAAALAAIDVQGPTLVEVGRASARLTGENAP